MSDVLEDIRAGDIMLCPDGVERKATGSEVRLHDGRTLWWFGSWVAGAWELRNPEFRVGDKVRWRGYDCGMLRTWGEPGRAFMDSRHYALVERAPVAEKRPLIMHPWRSTAPAVWLRTAMAHGKLCTLARVEQVALKNGPCWVSHFDGAGQHYSVTLDEAKYHVDQWLAREGWVEEGAPRHRTIAEYLLDPKTKTNTPRCVFCDHPGDKHYAGCCSRDPQTMEPHTRSKGLMNQAQSRADTWLDAKHQPAPIVVLCQNEEDVP